MSLYEHGLLKNHPELAFNLGYQHGMQAEWDPHKGFSCETPGLAMAYPRYGEGYESAIRFRKKNRAKQLLIGKRT